MPVRILIVDDSPLIRNLLRQALEAQAGWQVCGEAVNGKEGVEMAENVSPSLVVLDLSMPVMNGLEAARILSQRMPKIPLIMFTTFAAPPMEQEALSAGITKLIAKTGQFSDLIECARTLLHDAA
jgi:two-component system, chemotaxis family, chemotaxis protein CheY